MKGLFPILATVMLVGSYIAQKYLPAPKPRFIGIDLGTTYSCVGVYHSGSGTAEILANDVGKLVIPSVVSFIDSEDKNVPTNVVIGAPAKERALTHPSQTIYEAKRFIGKSYLSVAASAEQQRFPFKIVNQQGNPAFDIPLTRGHVEYTPEDIGAYIIKELKATAEKRLGVPIRHVVMAVPAEFNEAQRNATQRAGELAGLTVLRVISEPTAAALAYGLHNRQEVNTIMVYDFGGGTLDVALLGVQGGTFITHGLAGNKRLGGEDLSLRMMQWARTYLEKNHNIATLETEEREQLRQDLERAKIELSTTLWTLVPVQSTPAGGNTSRIILNLTRETFEEINMDLFSKCLVPVKRVLEAAEYDKKDIDEIVLVGGSTRIPKVRAMLTEFFDGKKPSASIDPDQAVAIGVAIQAGILAGAWPLHVSAIEIPFNLRKLEVDD